MLINQYLTSRHDEIKSKLNVPYINRFIINESHTWSEQVPNIVMYRYVLLMKGDNYWLMYYVRNKLKQTYKSNKYL